jgi:hypothetical protein
MSAEIIFGGGERLVVPAGDAESVIESLNRCRGGPIRIPGGQLAAGWVDVLSMDGVVLVNPDQVAYVRDLIP